MSLAVQSFVLTHPERPPSLNVVLNQRNRWARAAITKTWRQAFRDLALERHLPPMTAVHITAIPTLRNRRAMPDTAACVLAVKAGVDGLVDAGVLPHDGPQVVRSLLFVAPQVTGHDTLQLEVRTDLPGDAA